MRISKQDVPVRINVPGAIARQKTDFGDATGYGMISGEYFSLGAGTDISPLLQGLQGDLCKPRTGATYCKVNCQPPMRMARTKWPAVATCSTGHPGTR